MAWRHNLETWKKCPGRNESTVPKDKFTGLLNQLCSTFKQNNVISGLKKCDIVPISREYCTDPIYTAKL